MHRSANNCYNAKKFTCTENFIHINRRATYHTHTKSYTKSQSERERERETLFALVFKLKNLN